MSTEHSLQITNVMNVGSVQVTTLSHCTKWREEIRRVRDIQSVQCFLLATLIARTPNFPSHELCFLRGGWWSKAQEETVRGGGRA